MTYSLAMRKRVIALLTLLPLLLSSFQSVGEEKALEVDFSVLAGFQYKEGMTLPPEIQKLNGKLVRLVGFLRNEEQQNDCSEFWLVNQNCDCQGGPKMNEWVFCTMPEGKTIDLGDEPGVVIGRLQVGEQKEDEFVVSLYRLEVQKVD
jgi:hypothetical protein